MSDEKTAMLNWAEAAGVELARLHYQAAEDLAKSSGTTLTILLAGAGGALAYAARAIEVAASMSFVIAVSAVCAWLFLLSAVLVTTCLRVRDIMPMWNEPLNLFQPQHSLVSLRESELNNLQDRIKQIDRRNCSTATWLNAIRYAAVATPVIAGAAWLAASALL